ncbi:hypothetical protein Hanom_Chr05g00470011 [Helianthus anomalus]
MFFFWNGDFHVLGCRTPQIGEPRCPLRPNYVVLTRPKLASEFDLGVPSGNHTAGCHLTIVVPPQEQNSLA